MQKNVRIISSDVYRELRLRSHVGLLVNHIIIPPEPAQPEEPLLPEVDRANIVDGISDVLVRDDHHAHQPQHPSIEFIEGLAAEYGRDSEQRTTQNSHEVPRAELGTVQAIREASSSQTIMEEVMNALYNDSSAPQPPPLPQSLEPLQGQPTIEELVEAHRLLSSQQEVEAQL